MSVIITHINGYHLAIRILSPRVVTAFVSCYVVNPVPYPVEIDLDGVILFDAVPVLFPPRKRFPFVILPQPDEPDREVIVAP